MFHSLILGRWRKSPCYFEDVDVWQPFAANQLGRIKAKGGLPLAN